MPHTESQDSTFTTSGLNRRFKGDKGEPGGVGPQGPTVNAFGPLAIKQVNTTTTSYTIILSDLELTLVLANNALANTVTIPPNSEVNAAIGQQILITSIGAGQTTIVAGAGVTIRSAGSNLLLTQQFSGMSGVQIALNEWLIFGDLTT